MKRVTETDIVALRARAERTRKPKTKVGIDGTEQMTGSTFYATKDSLDIITEASRCHDAFYAFRKQADRSANYYKGNQWGDPVEIKDRFGCVKTITEEEYIKSQGRPALKQNLISPIIRNVLGQFRSAPYKSIVYSSDEGGQGAADQMSVKLDDVKRYNDSVERDAREYESFLNTGAAIDYTGYAYDTELGEPLPFFRSIDYHRYFQNPDANDVAGKDVYFCGDFVDLTIGEMKSLYAHNKAQEQALEDIYTHETHVMPTGYKAFIQRDLAADSIIGSASDGRCRVIRVCRLEGGWDLTVHDYADASFETYSLRDFPNKEEEVEYEIGRRKKMAADMGVDYEDPANQLLLVYEKRYVRRWMYYHLSPWGHILWQAENPYQHNSHCYVTKFYPLFQGQVYGLTYSLIDMQRMVNRMVINLDFAMAASQQGVLIVDENAISDDFDLEDIAEEWTKYRGVIKIRMKDGAMIPQQLAGHQVNIGQFEMINLMMKLMMDISGVQGAMQGQAPAAGTPASLYSQQVNNSQINVLDYAESFAWFLEQRDYKLIQIIQQFMGDGYSPAPDGASEEAKHYIAEEVKKYKLKNRIQKSVDTAVVRLFNNQLMANLLANGMASIQQWQAVGGAKPFGEDLMQKLGEAQQQLQNGQGISQQQIAGIQAALPQVTPENMSAAMQFANR